MHKCKILLKKEQGTTQEYPMASHLNNRWKYTTPGLSGITAMLNMK